MSRRKAKLRAAVARAGAVVPESLKLPGVSAVPAVVLPSPVPPTAITNPGSSLLDAAGVSKKERLVRTFQVRIEPELLVRFLDACSARDVTGGQVVRAAMRQFLVSGEVPKPVKGECL